MPATQITSQDLAKRKQVNDMAPSDPDGALKVARSIPHPWYRCQALSCVAEYTTTVPKKLNLLGEAFDTAQLQEEINRQVTVSSWPLRLLVPLDESEAQRRVAGLVAQADKEPHSLRRADALYSLVSASGKSTELVRLIESSLVTALLQGHGWRIDRLIRNTVQLPISPSNAERLLRHHSDGREKRRLFETLRPKV